MAKLGSLLNLNVPAVVTVLLLPVVWWAKFSEGLLEMVAFKFEFA